MITDSSQAMLNHMELHIKTPWENLASQRIAQKLGMVLYGEDWSIA